MSSSKAKRTRRPATKHSAPVPPTLEVAAQLELTMAARLNQIEKIKARCAAAKARVDASYEAMIAPLMNEVVALAAQVHAFAQSNRVVLTDGKSKSVVVGNAGTVQWLTSPHAVRITDEAGVIERLQSLELTDFIRIPPPEINREAMLETEESRTKASSIAGVTISQAEKVYVRPAGSRGHVESTLGKKGPGAWKAVWPKDEEKAQ